MRNKLAQHVLYRELKNLDILGYAQDLVSIDFIVKLLKLEELIIKTVYNSILVIVDRLIKFTYFIPYQENLIVEDLTYVVKKVLLGNYQMPREFILDYNKLFMSKFQKTLIVRLGVNYKLLISYYPQTNR